MTTAAEVVRLQADMMVAFRTPDDRVPGASFEVTTGRGERFTVPVSRLGRAVDHAMFGDRATGAAMAAALGPGRHEGVTDASQTVAPLVAQGVARGRPYRVQENMTDALTRRADGYSPASTFFDIAEADDGAGIEPPTSTGWALFEQPVPVLTEPINHDDPMISLITWNTVVQPDGKRWGTPVLWLVVLWEDMTRLRFLHAEEFGQQYSARVVPGQRFAPLNAYVITPGEALTGTPLEPGERAPGYETMRVRNMLHVVAALWQMCGETVPGADVDQEREHTDRRTQRAARTDGITGDMSGVTSVVLRREHRPVRNPGSGKPQESRTWIEERTAWRWVGPRNSPDRRRVRRAVRAHWSNNDLALPVRERVVVSELRR